MQACEYLRRLRNTDRSGRTVAEIVHSWVDMIRRQRTDYCLHKAKCADLLAKLCQLNIPMAKFLVCLGKNMNAIVILFLQAPHSACFIHWMTVSLKLIKEASYLATSSHIVYASRLRIGSVQIRLNLLSITLYPSPNNDSVVKIKFP